MPGMKKPTTAAQPALPRAPRSGLARWWRWLTHARPAPAKPEAAAQPATPAAKAKAEATPGPDTRQREQWKGGLLALGAVLDRHASSRKVFRHLAALEAAIGKHGPKALGRLPVQVLEQGLEQFEGLVRDWSQPALGFLRSALSSELTQRRRVRAAKEQELSVFVAPNKLQVDEDSESAFMEFQRHWAAANNEASGRPRRAA